MFNKILMKLAPKEKQFKKIFLILNKSVTIQKEPLQFVKTFQITLKKYFKPFFS